MDDRLKICQFCEEEFDSFIELNKHLVHLHVNEPDFSIQCVVCESRFHNYSSLRSHMSRLHSRHDLQNADIFEREAMDVDQPDINMENNENVENLHNLENIQDIEDMNVVDEYESDDHTEDNSEDDSEDNSDNGSEDNGEDNFNENVIDQDIGDNEKKTATAKFLLQLRAISTLSEGFNVSSVTFTKCC